MKSDLAQFALNKFAIADLWMRHGQSGMSDALVPEKQDIQIDGARTPMLTASSAELFFNILQEIEQRQGRKRGLNASDRVDVVGLGRADGPSFFQRRDVAHLD